MGRDVSREEVSRTGRGIPYFRHAPSQVPGEKANSCREIGERRVLWKRKTVVSPAVYVTLSG
jgi:hypothetical protein